MTLAEQRATGFPARLSPVAVYVGAGLLNVVAAFLGSAATTPNLLPWYATIAKPWFTPPNWVFPVAWTLLFTLMAVAFARAVLKAPDSGRRARVIAIYFVQLAFNVGWSFAFFGAQSPALGLAVIVPFLAAIGATIAVFWTVDRISAWLLVPYILWAAFAALLNGSIAWLNA